MYALVLHIIYYYVEKDEHYSFYNGLNLISSSTAMLQQFQKLVQS